MARATSSPIHKIQLYQFKDFDMGRYIELYRDRIAEKDINEVEAFIPLADFKLQTGLISQEEYVAEKDDEQLRLQGTIVHIERKRGVLKNEDRIISKCRYLQDAVIRRAFSKKGTMSFSLSSAILKTVIGHEYKRMLETFISMGYLRMGSDFLTDEVRKERYYTIGEHSTMFTLVCDKISTADCTDPVVIKYKEKTREEYEKQKSLAASEVDARYGKSFREHYIVSLRKIKIEDENGLYAHIDSQSSDHNKYYYYRFAVEALKDKDKTINRIDTAGRIYHCLTNLERELKQYLNIDFMLDCKNSHPLLFNYFIFNHYGISSEESYTIMSFIKKNTYTMDDLHFHNVGKNIRKLLINNNIEKQSVALLQDDELEYIYLTGTGQLWDIITERHPDKDRNEVKVQMFQEVFYSSTPYAYKWKGYAVEFKKQFPSVYQQIGEWKRKRLPKEIKDYLSDKGLAISKPTASLSVAMMNLEAQIFTGILKRLYAKRWNAVHIHDCIVIPKDGNKNHPAKEQVETIMADVYRDFGLAPTFG